MQIDPSVGEHEDLEVKILNVNVKRKFTENSMQKSQS